MRNKKINNCPVALSGKLDLDQEIKFWLLYNTTSGLALQLCRLYILLLHSKVFEIVMNSLKANSCHICNFLYILLKS